MPFAQNLMNLKSMYQTEFYKNKIKRAEKKKQNLIHSIRNQ